MRRLGPDILGESPTVRCTAHGLVSDSECWLDAAEPCISSGKYCFSESTNFKHSSRIRSSRYIHDMFDYVAMCDVNDIRVS